jgi:sortase B
MKKNILTGVIFVMALGIFCFSGYKIYNYWLTGHESRSYTETLANLAVVVDTPAEAEESNTTTNTTVVVEAQETVEKCPVVVDFEKLWIQNEDIVAWLYLPDTVISYPIAQSDDNDYYLKRLLDGSYNDAGTLFVDCRNSGDFSDWNTLVYGHNMKNKTMFGTLVSYKEQEYYDEHPYMYLMTPDASYKLELVAGYITNTESDVYDFPETQQERDELLDLVRSKSTFKSDVQVQEDDRLVTLSTCSYEYEDARFVVVGVLRQLEK